jgi:hypothetical protein
MRGREDRPCYSRRMARHTLRQCPAACWTAVHAEKLHNAITQVRWDGNRRYQAVCELHGFAIEHSSIVAATKQYGHAEGGRSRPHLGPAK